MLVRTTTISAQSVAHQRACDVVPRRTHDDRAVFFCTLRLYKLDVGVIRRTAVEEVEAVRERRTTLGVRDLVTNDVIVHAVDVESDRHAVRSAVLSELVACRHSVVVVRTVRPRDSGSVTITDVSPALDRVRDSLVEGDSTILAGTEDILTFAELLVVDREVYQRAFEHLDVELRVVVLVAVGDLLVETCTCLDLVTRSTEERELTISTLGRATIGKHVSLHFAELDFSKPLGVVYPCFLDLNLVAVVGVDEGVEEHHTAVLLDETLRSDLVVETDVREVVAHPVSLTEADTANTTRHFTLDDRVRVAEPATFQKLPCRDTILITISEDYTVDNLRAFVDRVILDVKRIDFVLLTHDDLTLEEVVFGEDQVEGREVATDVTVVFVDDSTALVASLDQRDIAPVAADNVPLVVVGRFYVLDRELAQESLEVLLGYFYS